MDLFTGQKDGVYEQDRKVEFMSRTDRWGLRAGRESELMEQDRKVEFISKTERRSQ